MLSDAPVATLSLITVQSCISPEASKIACTPAEVSRFTFILPLGRKVIGVGANDGGVIAACGTEIRYSGRDSTALDVVSVSSQIPSGGAFVAMAVQTVPS